MRLANSWVAIPEFLQAFYPEFFDPFFPISEEREPEESLSINREKRNASRVCTCKLVAESCDSTMVVDGNCDKGV